MCSYGQRSMCADLLNSYHFSYFFAPAFLPFYPIYRWGLGNVAKKMKFLITKARAALPTITQLWLSITPVTHFPPQLYRFSSSRQSHTSKSSVCLHFSCPLHNAAPASALRLSGTLPPDHRPKVSPSCSACSWNIFMICSVKIFRISRLGITRLYRFPSARPRWVRYPVMNNTLQTFPMSA